MKILMRTTDQYMVDTEDEAAQLIMDFKEKSKLEGYDLTKYETKYKCKKAKGEIVDQWYVVTVQKDFIVER